MTQDFPAAEEVRNRFGSLKAEAEASGYHLNPDLDLTMDLLRGLLTNERRYGYPCCPCRLASGKREEDIDIICPCDYRDPDVSDFGACYCALYVSQDVKDGRKKPGPVPERRGSMDEKRHQQPEKPFDARSQLSYPVWRCRVCGYLCARDEPPETCPICRAQKERFEKFI